MGTNLSRRRFFQEAAAGAVGVASAAAAGTRGVAIVVDLQDAVASTPAARWAAEELERALTERGAAARTYGTAAQAPAADLLIRAAGLASPGAAAALRPRARTRKQRRRRLRCAREGRASGRAGRTRGA